MGERSAEDVSRGNDEISRKTHAMATSGTSEYLGGDEASAVVEHPTSGGCCVSRGSVFGWDVVVIVVDASNSFTMRGLLYWHDLSATV